MSTTLGSLREYETVVVLQPELSDDAVNDALEKLREAVTRKNGEILREEGWGKKKLAFEIKKMPRGNFVTMHYVAPSDAVSEIERVIRNSDAIIRFTSHRLGEVTDIEAKRAEVDRIAKERAKRRQEQPEDDRPAFEERFDDRDGDEFEDSDSR
ncbi:MAG: 30S ribosomal protein S6 [Myxococcales bacterium]|nr:30S ribosomal protein S6 [Myxococcales bacterium]